MQRSAIQTPPPARHRAFTLIELLVSVGIFVVMTSLLVAKYGSFNQSVLLTNLAYDVAIAVRTAQTYGLSAKSAATSGSVLPSAAFQHAFGVHFSSTSGSNTTFTLFSDTDDNRVYTAGVDTSIAQYQLSRGAVISRMCFTSTNCMLNTSPAVADISFKRPNPDASICTAVGTCAWTFARIEIKGTDGSTRLVDIRSNGQISVNE